MKYNKKWYTLMLFTLEICSASYHLPSCHKGILNLFNWCEQSECQNNCTCLSSNLVCKQICGHKNCASMFCSSPETCYQSLLSNDDVVLPSAGRIISHSPIVQQDCTKGKCSLLKAIRYEKQSTKSFQSCSEGICGTMQSSADHVKQFCGTCTNMTCSGENATNCTQLCVLGKCKNMTCNAKYCKQLCAHESQCNMTCGENTISCEQECSHGSTCNMICNHGNCKQKCKTSSKKCSVQELRTTPTLKTTRSTDKITNTTVSTVSKDVITRKPIIIVSKLSKSEISSTVVIKASIWTIFIAVIYTFALYS